MPLSFWRSYAAKDSGTVLMLLLKLYMGSSNSLKCLQLQQDNLWSKWVDMAFQKLDSNGDGFLDLEEIISQLPMEDAENVTTRRERLLEVNTLHSMHQASIYDSASSIASRI